MITIHIDQFVNSTSVRWYSPEDGYLLNETHEDELGALLVLKTVLETKIKEEFKRRSYAATL